jgi:hypothetical protein
MKALALFSGIGVAMATTAACAAPVPAASGLAFTGKGTQIYACQDTTHGYAWMLNGPDAKLYDASGDVVGRHFFGPQWEANDGSRIKGKLLVSSASPGGPANAPWLVLRAEVEQGDGLFGDISLVTRTDTVGGGTPTSACGPQQKGQTVSVPYSARYTFFPAEHG